MLFLFCLYVESQSSFEYFFSPATGIQKYSKPEQIWLVRNGKMPAEELTVVSGQLKREAQGEKDSAFVPITANPFSCRESGDPLLACSDYTEEAM